MTVPGRAEADAAVLRPHDLLRVPLSALIPAETDAERRTADARAAAADAAPAGDAWVVVRRARVHDGLVPVGIRGATRGQRYAALVPRGDVTQAVAPHDIRDEPAPGRTRLPALAALAALRAAAGARHSPWWPPWGPGGSVGFELVTGRPTVTPDSDLDVVVRADEPLDPTGARRFADLAAAQPCRVDVHVLGPRGGFALTEWLRGSQVALRTVDGPRLVADPWQ